MPTILRTALVSHSAASMFALVLDVAAYPEFLPWCRTARVLEQSDTHQIASVGLSQSVQRAEFTTENELQANESIRMTLRDGPFRHLQGEWRFRPLSESACKVELEIEFEFASSVLAAAIGPVFNTACDRLVNAFIDRAAALANE